MNNLFPLNKISPTSPVRYTTNLDYFDAVLGKGLVKGSTLLTAGLPGAGKSTLLIQVAYRLSLINKIKVLYIAGEESKEQIKMRTERLSISSKSIFLLEDVQIEKILKTLDNLNPDIVIFDSLQMLYSLNLKQAPGTPTQMRFALQTLCKTGKERNTTMIFVGHATKTGIIAGLQTFQHIVDVVLYLILNKDGTRLLKTTKNRFGSIDNEYILYMEEGGLFDFQGSDTPFGKLEFFNLTEAQIYELSKKTFYQPFILFSLKWLKQQAVKRPEFKLSNGTFSLTSALIESILKDHPLIKPVVEKSIKWLIEKHGKN